MPRFLLPLATAIAAAIALVAAPTSAVANPVPAVPSQVHVVSATSTSLTVAAAPAAHATRYRAFASTVRSNVYVANIAKAKVSPVASVPRMTVSGFRYTRASIYYRIETLNGAHHAWDPIVHVGGLRPATPTGLTAHAPHTGPYLTWRAASVTGYYVYQATNATLSANRRVYTLHSRIPQFSPYGLAAGRTYYFRIRASTHGSASGYSALVSMRVPTRQQRLDVMTYNILEGTTAGQHEGGQTVASWAQRRQGVRDLIQQAAPDIVAVQEGAAWVGYPQGYGGRRQVDNLHDMLGGAYGLASTEIPPWQHHYLRTGNYILYRAATWAATGTHGFWFLNSAHSRTAAYQVLRNKSTGALVLAISAHLNIGSGAAADSRRQQEAHTLIGKANSVAAGRIPIVYAGDFNSNHNRNHVFDGAGDAMRAANVVDAERVAQAQRNKQYNSSNLYMRRPPAVDQSIDYVFAPPGVAVEARSVLMNLHNGQFVGVIPSDHNPIVARLYVSY